MRRVQRSVSIPAHVSLLLVGILALSLYTIPSSANPATITSMPADTGGPVFVDLGAMFVDLLLTGPDEVYCTLEIYVEVWDEVDVDLVIGSFKRTNETQWSNTTMSFLGYSRLDSHLHYFGANATQFAMSLSNRFALWNVKYYAHDALGLWNVSQTVNYSYCGLAYFTTTTTTTTNGAGPDFAVAAAVITTTIIIAVAVLLRPKKEFP